MKTTINLSSLSPPEPFGKKKVQCNGFLKKVFLPAANAPWMSLAGKDSRSCLVSGIVRSSRRSQQAPTSHTTVRTVPYTAVQ